MKFCLGCSCQNLPESAGGTIGLPGTAGTTLVPSRVGDAVAITDAGSAAHAHADARLATLEAAVFAINDTRLAHVAAFVRSPTALPQSFSQT